MSDFAAHLPALALACSIACAGVVAGADALPDPTRPPAIAIDPASTPAADPTAPLVLHAIFFAEGRRVAIINDQRLSERDVVQSARIVSIERDRVVLDRRGTRIDLRLVERDIKVPRPEEGVTANVAPTIEHTPTHESASPAAPGLDDPSLADPREGKDS